MSETASPQPQATFVGAGPNYTPLFQLAAGLAMFHGEHAGPGPFAVRLLSSETDRVYPVFNVAGDMASGGRAIRIERAGSFLLDVDTAPTDRWRLDVNPDWAPCVQASGPALLVSTGVVTAEGSSVPPVESEPAAEERSEADEAVIPVTASALSRPGDRPPLSYEELLEAAPAVAVHDLALPLATPYRFSTGSFGWRAKGKVPVPVIGLGEVSTYADVMLIVQGSKGPNPPLSEDDFLRTASRIDLHAIRLVATLRQFKSRSYGWQVQQEVRVPLGDEAIAARAQVYLTVVGSKPSVGVGQSMA